MEPIVSLSAPSLEADLCIKPPHVSEHIHRGEM